MSQRPHRFSDAESTIDWLVATVGNDIRLGAPLGLGKPATLMNALYQRAKNDPRINLSILTALSLEAPKASSELEKRIMEPIVERVFEDYPGLDYLTDLKAGRLPANVVVSEFFFQPASMLGNSHAQRHYRSVNYTHVARELIDSGVNVMMQMVAPGRHGDELSLSCNTDVTLDLIPAVEAARERGDTLLIVGQCNSRMPMMTRSALVDAHQADALFEGEAADYKPFGPPAMPVSDADYAIALRASTLLADGGTLQIGIGALSDAIAYCCDLRHNANATYVELVERMRRGPAERRLAEAIGGTNRFERGLYGCTEMLVDAYLQMYRAGVISRPVYADTPLQKLLDAGAIDETVSGATLRALQRAEVIGTVLSEREVDYLKRFGIFHARVRWRDGVLDAGDGGDSIAADLDDDTARGAIEDRCLGRHLAGRTLVHGGFFLGPNSFYDGLKALDEDQRGLFHMTSVGEINHLHGNESLKRAQRIQARYINTAIKATLGGAVTADGLENGQVLSGVGGQYNFVAQAHELDGGRSIICVRAVRESSDGTQSNIVSHYAHTTIPRHLRDIVVTEYGAADLRGKTDEQVAIAMIEIADARFQDELREAAVAAGKLSPDYRIPGRARGNTPENVRAQLAYAKRDERFPAYPYGTDFTDIERTLIDALKSLQGGSPTEMLQHLAGHATAVVSPPPEAEPYLQRLGLQRPRSWRESLYARVVTMALLNHGALDNRPSPAGSDDPA